MSGLDADTLPASMIEIRNVALPAIATSDASRDSARPRFGPSRTDAAFRPAGTMVPAT